MIAAALLSAGAAAQGFFLPANDLRLREDLTLLVDQGVIDLPVNDWPLARRDVAEAIAQLKPEDAGGCPRCAWRWRACSAPIAEPADADVWKIREVRADRGRSPACCATTRTPGRENGELTIRPAARSTDRYSITIARHRRGWTPVTARTCASTAATSACAGATGCSARTRSIAGGGRATRAA